MSLEEGDTPLDSFRETEEESSSGWNGFVGAVKNTAAILFFAPPSDPIGASDARESAASSMDYLSGNLEIVEDWYRKRIGWTIVSEKIEIPIVVSAGSGVGEAILPGWPLSLSVEDLRVETCDSSDVEIGYGFEDEDGKRIYDGVIARWHPTRGYIVPNGDLLSSVCEDRDWSRSPLIQMFALDVEPSYVEDLSVSENEGSTTIRRDEKSATLMLVAQHPSEAWRRATVERHVRTEAWIQTNWWKSVRKFVSPWTRSDAPLRIEVVPDHLVDRTYVTTISVEFCRIL